MRRNIDLSKIDYIKTTKRLLSYATNKYKIHLLIVFISIIVSASANAIGISFTKNLIDNYISPLLSQKLPDYSLLLQAIIWIGLIYLLGAICTYLYTRLMVNVSQNVLKDIRDDMFTHMQSLQISYFDNHITGDIMSYYTNDIDTLRQMISSSLPQLISAFFTIFSIIIAMFYIDVKMTLFILASLMLTIFTMKILGTKSGKHFIEQQEHIGQLNGYLEEMLEGQKVIKVFNHEKQAIEGFKNLNEKLRISSTKANIYSNLLMPIIANIGNLIYLLTAVVGSIFSITGFSALSLGSIAAFVQFTRSLTSPFMQISQQFNSILLSLAGADRIFKFLDTTSKKDKGYITLANVKKDGKILEKSEEKTGLWAWEDKSGKKTKYTQILGDVKFNNVYFGYTQDKMVLKDINLHAKPGQKIAFVGKTGAGKTTIINLINRFYEIQKGEILYDGIDITKIKKSELRKSLGIVLQDTHLFTGSIKDNIKFGKKDASDEEVIKAAKLANADYFIDKLPNAYDTLIDGNGGMLSQGQAQLLAIARAALINPPVLILDEATSSIDTRTELIVQKGMDSLMKGRTVFVVAHRLSTIQNADQIILLEQGQIIERGNHQELMALKGEYYQLYTGLSE